MVREAVVAGRFYPASDGELTSILDQLFKDQQPLKKVIAVISPHAGYIYSGALAAKTLSCITIPERVILLGPNHTGMGEKISLSPDDWRIPTGTVVCDREMSDFLLSCVNGIRTDREAHRNEHSLEVLLPFLLHLNPSVKIIPLTLSQLSFEQCRQLGKELATAIEKSNKEVLILVSSDMNHFSSRQRGSQLDKMAIDKLLSFDGPGLYQTVVSNSISMCGFIPATVAIEAALKLGAKNTDLVGYTDSGDVSGDTQRVVGYAGITMY